MTVPDRVRHAPAGPIVLFGGTGILGTRLARLVADRWPHRSIVVVGRSASRFEALGRELPRARFVGWDVTGDIPLDLEAAAIVTTVNDGADRILRAALAGGVPLVDVTRWTSRVATSVARTSIAHPASAVVFSSAWMGGLAPRIAALLAGRAGGAETIDTTIAYGLEDVAGDDAIDYMDRFWIPYEVADRGERRVVLPLRDGRTVDVGDMAVRAYLIDTPEQLTLPLSLGAQSVRTRLGFDSRLMTVAMAWLARLGVFCLLRAEVLRPLRRALLRSRGKGGETRFRVDVARHGSASSAVVRDRLGQAHLTAVGAFLSLRWVLGEGVQKAPAGVLFPELDPSVVDDIAVLRSFGVEVTA